MTLVVLFLLFFFFFNDTATTEIYTLSLHDALPIYRRDRLGDILVKHEKITSEHLDAAIHRQSKEHGKKLGEILVGMGVITQADLERYMRVQIERSEERRVGKECRSRWSPYH